MKSPIPASVPPPMVIGEGKLSLRAGGISISAFSGPLPSELIRLTNALIARSLSFDGDRRSTAWRRGAALRMGDDGASSGRSQAGRRAGIRLRRARIWPMVHKVLDTPAVRAVGQEGGGGHRFEVLDASEMIDVK